MDTHIIEQFWLLALTRMMWKYCVPERWRCYMQGVGTWNVPR